MGEKEAPANAFALKMQSMGLPVESHSVCGECKKHILNDIMTYTNKGGSNEQR
ncbi:MAG: hypothetical protein AB7U45_12055 [Desulfamplus sp.]